jgi:large subunit ribosomal protein L9
MKVLLCEDVSKLGWLGDIVEVNEGYARNYLLPQGLATVATEGNIRSLAKEKGKRAVQRIAQGKRLSKAAEAVAGAEAVLAAKANEQGHLFGSVNEKHIAANLRDQGFEVADSVVRLREHIKEVGTHEVTLKYSDAIKVSVSVVVVAESDEVPAEAEAEAEAEVSEEKE